MSVCRFTPDGRSFWTMAYANLGPPETPIRFERWSVDPPGTPAGPLAVTVLAGLLAAVDRRRSRPPATMTPGPPGA